MNELGAKTRKKINFYLVRNCILLKNNQYEDTLVLGFLSMSFYPFYEFNVNNWFSVNYWPRV